MDGLRRMIKIGAWSTVVGVSMTLGPAACSSGDTTTTGAPSTIASTFAQLELKLANGETGQEVPPDASVKAFSDSNLTPGESVRGYMLYEVPKQVLSNMVFEMAGDLSDERVRVELNL